MLTDSLKRDITLRLHKSVVKYTMMAGYYWDPNLAKFVSLETYYNWTWLASYYAGQLFQIALALFLYFFDEFNNEVSDNSVTISIENQQRNHNFLLLVGFAIWITVTQLLAVGSVAVEYRSEMIEGMNQILSLDTQLQTRFQNVRAENTKMTGSLVKIICWVTLLIPVLFLPSLFHPYNPLKGLVETFIEVSITIRSPFGWTCAVFQTYTVYLLTGPVVCLLILGVLTIHECQQWLEDATPIGSVTWRQGKRFIDTKYLGRVSEDRLVWLYRCSQLLMGIGNLTFGKRRISYHAIVTVVIFVLSSFTLIRNYEYLTSDGSLMGYSILALVVLAIILVVLVFYAECYLLDGLEKTCLEFRCNMLGVMNGNRRAKRVTSSLMPLALKTTYPFYIVNRSTFLEWCDVCVNNLVNLLVM